MSALLKAKSKIKTQRKPRVQYEVSQSLKRIRDVQKPTTQTAGQISSSNQSQAQTQAQTQSQSPPKKIQPSILEKFDI